MIMDLLQGNITQSEALNSCNAVISYESLPKGIRGFVFYYDGIYNIIVNNNLSYYLKRKTILHELAHIELNQLCQADKDMFSFKISEYEDKADAYIEMIKNNLKNIEKRK